MRFSKKTWTAVLVLLILGGRMPQSWASSGQFSKAVVMRVDQTQPTLPYRQRRSDSPLPPTEFDFDVTFRVNCSLYVERDATALDYLPGMIAQDRPVEIRLEKHFLYAKLENDRELKMEIVRGQNLKSDSCAAERTMP